MTSFPYSAQSADDCEKEHRSALLVLQQRSMAQAVVHLLGAENMLDFIGEFAIFSGYGKASSRGAIADFYSTIWGIQGPL